MAKILSINTALNSGSTGRIAEEIGLMAIRQGFDVYAAHGRYNNKSQLKYQRIGNDFSVLSHVLQSRLLDNHGFASTRATRRFIDKVELLQPDLIHLHNIHGYYLHVGLLFEYIKKKQIPLVWTLHDCWSMTGHCSYFDSVNCNKWETHCQQCPNKQAYPRSLFRDSSYANFSKKSTLFTGLDMVSLVTPSEWMASVVKDSYLHNYPVKVIHNGVDLSVFTPQAQASHPDWRFENKKMVLGVASIWDKRKGLADFVQLAGLLPANYQIVLVGLTKSQQQGLPVNITGISRTEHVAQLASLYARADVFVNPTYVDNFPTTNIEALACGTPVVTYHTGGSPEAVTEKTGWAIARGDVPGLAKVVQDVCQSDRELIRNSCRQRAVECYDKNSRYMDYIDLYKQFI